jgi:hypothetical protein
VGEKSKGGGGWGIKIFMRGHCVDRICCGVVMWIGGGCFCMSDLGGSWLWYVYMGLRLSGSLFC